MAGKLHTPPVFDPSRFMGADPDTLAREFYDEPMAEAIAEPKLETTLLTATERQSSTWKKVCAWLDYRLAELREQNDSSISTLETEYLRGKIAFLKEIRSAVLNRGPIEGEDNPLPGDDLGY